LKESRDDLLEEPPEPGPGEVTLRTVSSEEEIASAIAGLDVDKLNQEGKIFCFIAQPLPPSLNPSGGSMTAFGAVGCTGPVALGIRVCIEREGVPVTCAPSTSTYKWVFGATNSYWANRPGCKQGARYSTKVDVEARANNVSKNSKESIGKRLC
jgi:hypothetical protein